MAAATCLPGRRPHPRIYLFLQQLINFKSICMTCVKFSHGFWISFMYGLCMRGQDDATFLSVHAGFSCLILQHTANRAGLTERRTTHRPPPWGWPAQLYNTAGQPPQPNCTTRLASTCQMHKMAQHLQPHIHPLTLCNLHISILPVQRHPCPSTQLAARNTTAHPQCMHGCQ